MSKQTPIADWLGLSPNHTQARLGELVGFTQGGIGKIIRAGRRVFVVEGSEGKVSLVEEKKLISPSISKKKTA